MNAGYQNMAQYGQAGSPGMYGQPGQRSSMPNQAAYVQQQQQQQQYQQRQGQSPAMMGGAGYQQPYKGTLAPGTRVKVGNITVTVKRYLSEGGFAHVYLVTTSQPIPMPSSVTGAVGASMANGSGSIERGETVHVLKRMAVPDKTALADVRREVEVHKLLRNQPNIVHFIEASATALPGGGYEIFILMEYCSGGGIISLMNARLRDRLREEEVLKIFGDVCAGVAVMHHLDPPLMHRDLKVENILMAPSTDPSSVPGSKSTASNLKATFKLCDFGSAAPVLSRKPARSMDEVKRVEADLNKHTTLQYRAPEMVDVYQRRVIDEKADIWALGVLLYKLCYYTTPFEENGGGPLAILNVQYRIPPQPVYSQRVKDLINTMLKEQSTDRPTIDQVILDVHKILGTRPPSASVHYAQQTAAGKIAAPLPTVVGGTKEAVSRVDIASVVTGSASEPRSGASDLISIGPSRKEREEAEARELELQKQNITPMRRGRPTKGSATEPSKPDAAPQSNPTSKAFGMASDRFTSAADSVPSPTSTPSAASATNKPATAAKWSVPDRSSSPVKTGSLIEGFGDSFSPSSKVSDAGSAPAKPPTLPKRPSSNSVPTQPSETGSGGGKRSPGSPNVPDKAVDRNLLRASSNAPSPAVSPLRHSPALPGFSVAPSPASSPPPSSSEPVVSAPVKSPLSRSSTERDELTDRFPSLADLDAQYATQTPSSLAPPGTSPSALSGPSSIPSETGASDSTFTSKSSMQIPGLANRASVGAMAGRFEKPSEYSQPSTRASISKSATLASLPSGYGASKSATGTGNVLKRWQPDSSSDNKPASTSPGGLSTSNGTSAAAKDWLTGDGVDDDEAATPSSSSQHPSDKQRILASKPVGPSSQKSLPPKPSTFDRSSKPSPTAADDSSDEDQAGPEDADAGRNRFAGRGGTAAAPSLPHKKPAAVAVEQDKEEREKPERPRLQVPGRVKAPSWLVDAVNSPTAADKLVNASATSPSSIGKKNDLISPVTDATAAEKLDEAAKHAQDQLEELLRGPTSAPASVSPSPGTGASVDKTIGDGSPQPQPAASATRVKAPAWDDEDDDEMQALAKPSLVASSRSPLPSPAAQQSRDSEKLVDFSSSSPVPAEEDSTVGPLVGTEGRPLVDLMDDDDTTDMPSTPSISAPQAQRKFTDVATSPASFSKSRNSSWDSPTSSTAPASASAASSSASNQINRLNGQFAQLSTTSSEFNGGSSDATSAPQGKTSSLIAQRQQQFGSLSSPTSSSGSLHLQPSAPNVIRRPTPVRATKPSNYSTSFSSGGHNGASNRTVPGSGTGMGTGVASTSTGTSGGGGGGAGLGHLRTGSLSGTGSGSASAGMKPWEREAAISASYARSSVVKNSALPAASTARLSSTNHHDHGNDKSANDDEDGSRLDSAASGANPRDRLRNRSNSSAATASKSQDEDTDDTGFSGVSNLISRWQQNVESNAPGWGKVGTSNYTPHQRR